jgi:hypothetical protein
LTLVPPLTTIGSIQSFTFAIAMADIEPSISPNLQRPKAGFTAYAERLNGRAAMVGFVLVIAIEYLTGQGILSWLGLA